MYADASARGGVLEPEGIVEIKFRAADLIAAMHRLDPTIQKLVVSDFGHIGLLISWLHPSGQERLTCNPPLKGRRHMILSMRADCFAYCVES